MFVLESVEDILRPIHQKDIRQKIAELDDEQKERLVYNRGLEKTTGDFEDFFKFIEENVPAIWGRILDILNDDPESFQIDQEEAEEQISWADLVDFALTSLSNKEMDKLLQELIPGYIAEGIGDFLKPKSEEDIDKAIYNKFSEELNVELIRQKLENNRGKLLLLYIWDSDINIIRTSPDPDFIFQEVFKYVSEAYEGDWNRKVIVLTIDPNKNGYFGDEGTGSWVRGYTKYLFEIQTIQTYNGIANINAEFGK